MERKHNSKIVPFAKELRKNMTKEERHLWYDFLKTLPITVNRQKVIGTYIVDFYIATAKLVIELDGSGHLNNDQREYDIIRDEYLKKRGYKIIRIFNNELNNIESVLEFIKLNINPSP